MSITTSEIRTWQRCRAEWQISYLFGHRPRVKETPLRFGTLVHRGLEAWWKHHDWVRAIDEGEAKDEYERAKARAMLCGYTAKWGPEQLDIEVLGVEKKFALPRDGYVLAGMLDAIARRDGRTYVIEHKTSSDDISPGSDYWSRLTIDDQISNYLPGAKSLGFDVVGCVYDVLGVPTTEPKLATPAEKRKYTKAGALYANQREDSESVQEYEDRVIEELMNNLDAYYQRAEIVRLESEEQRARDEARTLALEIVQAESEPDKLQPRNPGACRRFGRPCGYLPVCSGETDLFDIRYRKATAKHEELA